MKKFLITVFIFLLITGLKSFAENIFEHKTDAKTASQKIPLFESTSCKFSQEKYMKTAQAHIKSGGNFKFLKDRGVIFETLYPIQSTSTYTKGQNKIVYTKGQNKIVNSIIRAISSKNYSYLEKNFDIYYKGTKDLWILALKPKASNEMNSEILSIQIKGTSYNNKGTISQIIIDAKGTKTTLSFTNCG